MKEIRDFLSKFNNYYVEGIYTKLEVYNQFIRFITINDSHKAFIEALKSFSNEWYSGFLEWFEKGFPSNEPLNNIVSFGESPSDLETFKKSIYKLRTIIEAESETRRKQ